MTVQKLTPLEIAILSYYHEMTLYDFFDGNYQLGSAIGKAIKHLCELCFLRPYTEKELEEEFGPNPEQRSKYRILPAGHDHMLALVEVPIEKPAVNSSKTLDENTITSLQFDILLHYCFRYNDYEEGCSTVFESTGIINTLIDARLLVVRGSASMAKYSITDHGKEIVYKAIKLKQMNNKVEVSDSVPEDPRSTRREALDFLIRADAELVIKAYELGDDEIWLLAEFVRITHNSNKHMGCNLTNLIRQGTNLAKVIDAYKCWCVKVEIPLETMSQVMGRFNRDRRSWSRHHET